MPPIGQAPLISQTSHKKPQQQNTPSQKTHVPKSATLPRQTSTFSSFTGAFNPLFRHATCEIKDDSTKIEEHNPGANGYIDIGPSSTHSPSPSDTPPSPSNPMSKYGVLTFGVLLGSGLENALRQPAGYVATQYVMESKSFPDIFATIRQNPGKLYGSFSAFKFNTFARFFQRGGCFEINHSLNGHLKDLSPTQKALITTGIVTAYEYLVNTPVDRAMTLYQADKVKHPGEAFKMNNLGELWRTLKSPATWEAGGAVLARNLTFNVVMVAAMQNEPESVKSTPMHYGYLAATSLTCALASQPFEVLRFERTKEEKPTSYFKKFTNLLREGGISRLWKGSIPRGTSVGGGLMVSLTVYSEVKKVIANMENGNSQA